MLASTGSHSIEAPVADADARERRIATWLHVSTFFGWIVPLGQLAVPTCLWLWRRGGSAFVDHHGKQVIRFQLVVTLVAYPMVFAMGADGDVAVVLALPLLVLGAVELALLARAAIGAHRGEWYRYPLPEL